MLPGTIPVYSALFTAYHFILVLIIFTQLLHILSFSLVVFHGCHGRDTTRSAEVEKLSMNI